MRAAPSSRPARLLAWAEVPGAGLAAARLGVERLEGEVAVHAELVVGGRTVAWWPGERDDAGVDRRVDHVDGTADALGRALAWRMGAWPLRQALAEAFGCPDRADALAAEDAVGR